MRKTLAVLAALVATGLATAAGPAAADVSNRYVKDYRSVGG